MHTSQTLSASLLAVALTLAFPLSASGKSKSGHQSHHASHHDPEFSGFQVPLSKLRSDPLPRPTGELKLVSVNFHGETLELNIYNPDGSFNEDSLEKLYHFWRCRRTGTEKPINPHLFEVLSIIYDHFQSPIELVSGFRNQEHTSSFHFHGSASDIRVQGVDADVVHEFVTSLDGGGMGIGRYPRAHFVHVDVRPEPSFRWVDRSPPGENMGHPHSHSKSQKDKKHHNA